MGRKQIGSIAERELVNKFWKYNWAAFRAAGSGSIPHPCPDIIAGNSLRKIGIEVKFIGDTKKYFPKKEIEELREFCHIFGAEPWIGMKFKRKGWHFFSIEDLRETESSFAVSIEDSSLKGFSFEELIKTAYK